MPSIIPSLPVILLQCAAGISAILAPIALHNAEIREANSATSDAAFTSEVPRTAFDFVNSIGLNTHLNYFDRIYGNFPLVKRDLQSLGVRHLRDGVHLQNPDYNHMLYGRWIQLGDFGVRFDAVFDPRSKLAALNAALLNSVDSWAGHTIESFEGPNEFDISNDSDWPVIDRKYQRELFNASKAMKSDSSITIIGPSLASAANSDRIGDLSNIMNEGNLHPYPAGQMPSVIFPSQINLERIVCGGKPIVFTETGYHNAIDEHNDQPGISETAAAKYIPRLFLEDFRQGIPRTYLYEFMDEAPDPSLRDPQMHWGLIRADGSEKPAFEALKNLIAELNDSSEPANLNTLTWRLGSVEPQVHQVLLQKSNGQDDLVFWHEVSSYDVREHRDLNSPPVDTVLILKRRARAVTIYQPTRQAEPIQTLREVTTVPLAIPDDPLVVEISN